MKPKTRVRLLIACAAVLLVIPLIVWNRPTEAARQGEEANPRTVRKTRNVGYRSRGERHKLEVDDPAISAALRASGALLVADYGSHQLYEVSSDTVNELAPAENVEVRDEYNLLLLNTGEIDTVADVSKSTSQSGQGSGNKSMQIVQFVGPVKPDWYEALRSTGMRIVSYIPHNAYVVYGGPRQLVLFNRWASRAAFVQWHGQFVDEFKLQPGVEKKVDQEQGRRERELNREGQLTNVAGATGDLFAVQLLNDKEENGTTITLIERLQTEPTLSQWDILDYRNFIIRLDTDGVAQVAKRPDVISIAPWVVPTKFDERQNQIVAGNLTGNAPTAGGDWLAYLASKGFTQTQFDASGFAVNISDSGVDNATQLPNHFALWMSGILGGTSRILYNRLEGLPNPGSTLQGCDGHGNLNSHIIGGFVPTGAPFNAFPHSDAAGFRYGIGVAPFVRMGSSVIFDPNSFTNPNLVNLEARAYNDGARISSNSWGANVGGAYNIASQTFDAIVRDAQSATSAIPVAGNQEYVVIFAAGNAGSGAQTVGAPGSAKNVITVGAAENVHPHGATDGCGVSDAGADSINDIIGFSSRGPTTDQRRKPEIVAPGTHVTGGVFQETNTPPVNGDASPCFSATGVCALQGAGNFFFPVGQQWYTTSSGTSHSTPSVSGGAALIRQYFINQGSSPPTPAMTKAALMNTARYMTGAGANDTLWSNVQGMGEMNLNSFFDLFATPTVRKDQINADMFTATGQQRLVAGNVDSAAKPFRVTLAWTDPPGPTTGNAFINNLDLEVTVGGNTYKGNVFAGAFSATGGSSDIRNNAESVFIPAGVSGTFIVKVKATNIAGNGVPNNATPLDQDFALIIYNAVEAPVAVVEGTSATLTAESCTPADNAISPGENVTVAVALTNVGTANTTNLVATLQATGGVTLPSGPQNYGVVPAGGVSVTRSFSFTADPSLACGSTITLTFQLQDGATNLGTVTFTFSLGALGPPAPAVDYSAGMIAVPVPDLTTVEVPITVPDTGSVADVNVRVRINHTFDSDLDISLVHPDGTVIDLSSDNGGAGDNYGSGANDCSGVLTVFDDSAATAITGGAPPFAGMFRPEQALSALNGKPSAGTWKLRVADDAGLDTGTIFCFQLQIIRRNFYCCGLPGTPIVTGGGQPVLQAETCTPANGAPDPEETVTVAFPLQNAGTGLTTNLVATLLATGGVNAPSGPQTYGVISPINPPVSRSFTFVPSGTCGSDITATLQLQDGATNLGTVTFTIRLGTTLTTTSTFSNPASISIPATGTAGIATPYPSTIAVAGMTGPVSKVVVKLTNFNHTFPDDVDILLVGPSGQKVVIMSDVGGGTDAVNVTLTLDDAAVSGLPDAGPLVSGTFMPTNIGAVDTFPAPAPSAPYGAALAAFNGTNPNGIWSLFAVDAFSLDAGSLMGGWELTISTTVPVCCTTPCVLTCPANITQNNDPGQCGAVVNYTVGFSGSCGVVTSTPPSGSFFPVGTTTVNVKATRLSDGVMETCSFTVTVVDSQAPTVTTTIGTTSLWPPNNKLVNVGLGATISDNCGVASTQVLVYSNEDDGSGPHSPDATALGIGTLMLRAEKADQGNGRVYLIVVKVTDTAGNIKYSVQAVVVPKAQSAAKIAEANAAGEAAKNYFTLFNMPPPGFVPVGDGPP